MTTLVSRSPEHLDTLAADLPVLGDLTDFKASGLAGHLHGCDAVVFTAGAPDQGPQIADAVDGRGLAIAAHAVLEAGVQRFVHLSAFPDAWRGRNMGADFEHCMEVKMVCWEQRRPGGCHCVRRVSRRRRACLAAAEPGLLIRVESATDCDGPLPVCGARYMAIALFSGWVLAGCHWSGSMVKMLSVPVTRRSRAG